MEITEQNLEQLGLNLGQRKIILKVITNLRNQKPSRSKTLQQEDARQMVVNTFQNVDDFDLSAENKENDEQNNSLKSSKLTFSIGNKTVLNNENENENLQCSSLPSPNNQSSNLQFRIYYC